MTLYFLSASVTTQIGNVSSVASQPHVIDVDHLLNAGVYSTMQKIVVLLAALSVVLDGFDSQLIGFSIPVMIKEWGVTRAAFSPVVAAGLIGMGVGSACAGLLADRFGRRWALIGSVLIFGAATCSIGFASGIVSLSILRFIAGLGIGGALPGATTMTAEFTPARRRTLAVTATIVCVPLGGMFAGFFSHQILPAYGWRGMFTVGGIPPLVLGVLLFFILPESPHFLARRPRRWDELRRLLGRMSYPLAGDCRFADARQLAGEKRAGFTALFRQGLALDTLAIWCAFCLCLLAIYSAFSWLPTMLSTQGLSLSVAGAGLTAYNLGGVIGALLCALVITRTGSRWPLIICSAGSAVSALLLLSVNISEQTGLLIFGLGVHGLFVNAVQSTMYALCAYIYPTPMRATGTASAVAFGRLGTIASAFAGAAVITAGGASSYLWMLGISMMIVTIALMLVRNHIPKLGM